MSMRDPFKALSAQLEEAYSLKEKTAFAAFSILEEHLADFSSMLITGLGGRSRAIRWMCMHHRTLEGRNAYQVIADGEVDRLWEEVTRACGLAD
ncbi:hypothetical protein [Pinirhizobacter soli]|uniref:hypothetical protein n=1 Tax=Pinirhizobacter soli TaxID=2786953 RepID=UPI00202AA0AD|nr:hypothetical protein [Pinirhizobacter soli]